jgi:hypothetical protein
VERDPVVRGVGISILAVAVLLAAVGCGGSRLRPAEEGQADSPGGSPAASSGLPRDTIFTHWFFNPPYDSGYHFVRVDEAGDTVALFLRWMVGEHPHIRMVGPLGGISLGRRTKLLGLHRIEIQNPGQTFSGAEDFCTRGGHGDIVDLKLEKLYETPDSISWMQSWRFIKELAHISDTLEVERRVLMRRSDPYFLVRYEFTWVDAEPESLRFLWHLQRQTKLGKSRSRHEVGLAPGYGMVASCRAFAARDLGYLAGMMRIGNPRAAYEDVLADGTPSHMSPEIMWDFGSGEPGFTAGFIRFNPLHDIYPEQIVWVDTTGHYVPSLHYDSAEVHVDTTNVLDGTGRFLIGRSRPMAFRQGETRIMEYAVGRAVVVPVEEGKIERMEPLAGGAVVLPAGSGKPDEDTPVVVIPDIKWSDGTPVNRQLY